jgi:DNA-binding NarL/FixJ family response regulator
MAHTRHTPPNVARRKKLKSVGITNAERNVLRCITLSNKEIADKLGISESAVKKHLWSIFQKLGIESRQQVLEFAVSAQLLKHTLL